MNAKIINDEDKFRVLFARLDWVKILNNAINGRPTSFYPIGFEPKKMIFEGKDLTATKYSPCEWRNASDQIYGAVLHSMEESGILTPIFVSRDRKKVIM